MNGTGRFRDQVAIVTGGGSGIGLGIGRRIAREGGSVILADINADALARARETANDPLQTHQCDVTDETSVGDLMAACLESHGKIDIVVNSAGIVGPSSTDISDYDLADFRRTLDVNLTGSFIVCKAAVAAMLPRESGVILLLASIAGKEGNPGMAGYSASKAGVIGLTKCVGKEVARRGIRVNALAPALIATPLTEQIAEAQLDYMTERIPMGRLGTVDEVAALACWLASREASFSAGAVFDLSGGRATY